MMATTCQKLSTTILVFVGIFLCLFVRHMASLDLIEDSCGFWIGVLIILVIILVLIIIWCKDTDGPITMPKHVAPEQSPAVSNQLQISTIQSPSNPRSLTTLERQHLNQPWHNLQYNSALSAPSNQSVDSTLPHYSPNTLASLQLDDPPPPYPGTT